MSRLAPLIAALREAARPGIWSTGVKLARSGAVALESQDAEEAVLRVKAPGRPVALTAVLYPEGEEWECDCPGQVDPCEHVVAAAIALQSSEAEGAAPLVSVAERGARMVYRFTRVEGGLALQRTLALPDGTDAPLERSVTASLSAPGAGPKLQVEQHDLLVDRLLERATRGAVAPERLDSLLQALEPARTVLLDGVPIAIGADEVLPRVVVEDRGEGIAVTMTRDPRVTEVLSPGVALCGDALCRLGATDLTGAWLERLPAVRSYRLDQLGELTTQVLPEWGRRFAVEVRTQRLPRIDRRLQPRLLLELSQAENQLSALPLLVYGAPPVARVDGGRLTFLGGAVPIRDEAAEQRLIHQLRDELNLAPGHRSFFQGDDRLRFAEKLRTWRGDLGGEASKVLSSSARLKPVFSATARAGADGVPEGAFSLEFCVEGAEGGEASIDAGTVFRAWQEGLGLVPLPGGGWAPLPRAWLEKHGGVVADLLAARQENGRLANHALPQLAALCDTLEQPRPPELAGLAALASDFDHLPEAPLPADLVAELRPYQRLGVNWLGFLRKAGVGGVLADDMGLGKTLQALCAITTRTLIVCPTSVLPNWVAEAKRFRPGLKLSVYHGSSRALDPTADATITSYAILRLDAAALAATPWDMVILDEAQAIKNPDSIVARAAFGLEAKLRVALSGTPIENRLDELWSVMHFVNRGLLGGRRDFEETLARPIAEGNRTASATLRRKIRPFVLRRLKKDVAPELPPKIESVLRVTLDESERAVYDAIHASTRAEVVAMLGQGGGVMKALELLLRLRQAACHSGLVPGQTARSSSKMRVLTEALATAAEAGHRALVFSQWTGLLDRIEPELKQADLAFERLDGSTADRGAVVERFQAPGGPPVMLISLKAGGTGLNLTAADQVYLVDPWWNPAVEAQAADRAHRIGQERTVFVHRLVSEGTVEERILLMQDKKRALFDAALGDAPTAGITRDDLLALLE